MQDQFVLNLLKRELATLDRRVATQQAFGSQSVIVNENGDALYVNGTARTGISHHEVGSASNILMTTANDAAARSKLIPGSRVEPADAVLAKYRKNLELSIEAFTEKEGGPWFDVVADGIGDVLTKEEWEQHVEVGAFIRSDGCGYWGTETHYSYDLNCFDPAPEGATHVHWFNK